MRSPIIKLTWRTIRSFFGRYMALLLIVALSVGFFAGLKITKDAMVNTGEKYLKERNFYDFRLLSTVGFSKEDEEELKELSFVFEAEATKNLDVMMEYGEKPMPCKLLSLPERVNIPSLDSGRMPEKENECIGDAKIFSSDDIGKVIAVSAENGEKIEGQLSVKEFVIVGIAHSPMYIGIDRGETDIGSGALRGFLYIPETCFLFDYYTEINLTLKESAAIYSDAYNNLISGKKAEVEDKCAALAEKRYREILSGLGLTPDMAEQMGMAKPRSYVLGRSENKGYINFENDTGIISGIANIFPVFFILIALLVCMTTMTRMVDEERTQSGVLKAMGFSDRAVTGKYLLYAGSATVIGWAIGFFLGTWGLPKIFWFVYHALYSFAPLRFLFSPLWAMLTLGVSLVGILGCTYLSCRKEMKSRPAALIRPRAARSGKRILLERIPFIWKRLKFLQKISLRNLFRYKKRMIMMLIGIGACTGLVVTAFGIRDSMLHIGDLHYGTVQKYGIEVSFSDSDIEKVLSEISSVGGIESTLSCSVHRVDIRSGGKLSTVRLFGFGNTDGIEDFWDFHDGKNQIDFPKKGEAVISMRAAERLSLSVGDTLTIESSDRKTLTVIVSGIFDCYIDNFAVISADTYEEAFGDWAENTALLRLNGEDPDVVEKLTAIDGVSGVSRLSDTKDIVDKALGCLKYVIFIVVLFSGALSFIVIFNLTNINLAERSREVATVQVLGFYPSETESYVLRENLVLSVLAGFVGLPLGALFHRAVITMIVINILAFPIQIKPVSYLLSLICTVLFAAAVNLFMKRQIAKIRMAESLKAVE